MSNSKVWLFRGLVAVVAGLLLLSWSMPWWSIDIHEVGKDAVVIHPWGLETNLRPAEYGLIETAEMPGWFSPFMFAYLGIAVLALLVGLFVKDIKLGIGKLKLGLPLILVGGVGLSYVVVVVTAVVYASVRMADFFSGAVKLIGYSFIDLGEPYVSGADAGLLPGYWLACLVGPMLIALALLRSKIVGEPKSST